MTPFSVIPCLYFPLLFFFFFWQQFLELVYWIKGMTFEKTPYPYCQMSFQKDCTYFHSPWKYINPISILTRIERYYFLRMFVNWKGEDDRNDSSNDNNIIINHDNRTYWSPLTGHSSRKIFILSHLIFTTAGRGGWYYHPF